MLTHDEYKQLQKFNIYHNINVIGCIVDCNTCIFYMTKYSEDSCNASIFYEQYMEYQQALIKKIQEL